MSKHTIEPREKVQVFTDGSCRDGSGGIAYSLCREDGTQSCYSRKYIDTTPVRMELLAVLTALTHLDTDGTADITVLTDCMHIVSTANSGTLNYCRMHGFDGSGSLEPNSDLWLRLAIEMEKHKKVKFQWIKGHANNPVNNRCHFLANRKRKDETSKALRDFRLSLADIATLYG